METIYLITRKGYGIEVQIDEGNLEQLKKLFAEGDSVTSIEEN